MSLEEEKNSKLAQFYHAIQNKDELVDEILPDRYINSQISSNTYLESQKSKLIGCTPLHLALERSAKKTLDHLLILGADFTIKNKYGSTVLHEAIKFIYEDFNNNVWKSRFSLINSIFQAHLNRENDDNRLKEINPCDNKGISHFHIACITNNVEVVKWFLDRKTPVNQTVHFGCPHFSGYTPLHFAERFFAFETAKLLLDQGADVNLKDARGMTPIHIFLEQHLKTVDLIHFGKDVPPYVDIGKIDEGVELNLKMLYPGNENRNADFVDDIGLSCLHVACTMTSNTRLVEEFLKLNINIDKAVKSDSPIFQNYTALDFAVKSYNVEMVKILIENKATLPKRFWLDCIPNYTTEDVHSMMSALPNCNDVLFSDGVTKVLDFIYAMRSVDTFRSFLGGIEDVNISVLSDSAFLPCFTPLHLAVLFTARPINIGTRWADDETLELGLVQELLNRGADVTAPRECGYTAVKDAFELEKLRVVNLLLNHYNSSKNACGVGNLSTLHIACAAKNTDLVEKLLKNRANPNQPTMWFKYEWFNLDVLDKNTLDISNNKAGCMFDICPGSTPLHVAVATRSYDIVKMLLDHKADRHAKDCKGFTPIHLLLSNSSDSESGRIADLLLFSRRDVEDRLTDINCSYLHVASSFSHNEDRDSAMKDNFLLSSNINAAITTIAVRPELKLIFSWMDKLLIYLGRGEEGKTNTAVTIGRWLTRNLPLIDNFLMYVGIYEENGRTDRMKKYILDNYLGHTPLDIAIKNDNALAVKVLIQNRANIFVKKPNGSTPFYELLSKSHNEEMHSCLQYIIERRKRDDAFRDDIKKRLEEDSGLTMLHLAVCIRDFKMVKSLLDSGADVNATTHTDSSIWPGYTPLHVLLETSARIYDESNQTVIDEILDLLLDTKTNVQLESAKGESSICLLDRLSGSCDSEDQTRDSMMTNRMRKLMKNVRIFTINPLNYQGVTLFHLACKFNETHTVEGYLRQDINYSNLKIDYFHEEFGGYTPLLFILASNWRRWCTEDSCFKTINLLLDNGADVRTVDYHGNNAIHLAVSHERWTLSAEQYSYLVQRLQQRGCDVNQKNNQGRTPLHTATERRNYEAVSELLLAGADWNIVDEKDKTPFAYVLEPCDDWDDSRKNVIITYILHLCKLEATESTINEIHKQVRRNVLEKFEENRIDLDSLYTKEWFERESKRLREKCSTASRIQFNRERLSFFSF